MATKKAPEEELPEETKNFIKNVRSKTVRQLVEEDVKARKEESKPEIEKPVEEAKEVKEENQSPKPEEEIKKEEVKEEPKVDTDEIVSKTAKATASEVAEKILEIQTNKDLTEAQKAKKTEELKVHFKGVDKDGNAAPLNWEEVVSESLRLMENRMQDFYKKQKEDELAEMKKAQEEDKIKQEEETKNQEIRVAETTKRINSEIEELYALGKLERPKDIDSDEPAAMRVRDLFRQAIEHNNKLKSEGKPLVDSITKFFLLYYKPSDEQPAGAEAPISGNQPVEAENPEKFNYARDIHNKSFKQIIMDATRKMRVR